MAQPGTTTRRATAPRARGGNRGRPPLAEAERYRQRILNATTSVFLERGFAGASTNEIVRRAQSSKQTLYALFPTKADLFVGVMSARMEELFSRHPYFVESGKSPRSTLTEIGTAALRMFSSPDFLALYRILVGEVQKFPEPARLFWHTCVERGYMLLAEYLRSRRLGGPDYTRSASQFISGVLGDYVLNAMLNPDLALGEKELSMIHGGSGQAGAGGLA